MKGGRGSNRGGSALTWVSGECEGPGGSGKIFLVFQGLFFYMLGAGSQVSIEHDGSNILENKHIVTETHTLSFSLLLIELFTPSVVHMCARNHIYT